MKHIAVIFGGRSAEHDVSIVTAIASVIKPLQLNDEFRVEPIYIAKSGAWYWDDKLADIKLYRSGEIDDFMQKASKVQLLFDDGLTLIKSLGFGGRKKTQKIDVVFPAMHGTHGEDGELMGVLEMAGVPYVGCGLEASVIAMNKITSKQVTEAVGIKSPCWVSLDSHELVDSRQSILDRIKPLRYPLFVKPAHLGSSIGITKVDKADQLVNALEVAAHYDNKIIVEEGVQNLIEVTLPIMGNNELMPSYLEQAILKSDDFFDFETKYIAEGGKKGKGAKKGGEGYSKIPADLPKPLYDKAEKVALDAYRAIGCSGISRVDLLIDSKTKEVYFNELNPMPGDLYAHNWRKKGVSNVELVNKLVALALDRHKDLTQYHTSFTTNYLKQF